MCIRDREIVTSPHCASRRIPVFVASMRVHGEQSAWWREVARVFSAVRSGPLFAQFRVGWPGLTVAHRDLARQLDSEHGPGADLGLALDGAAVALDQLVDCLLYTSDAADERSSVDLGGRRI